MVAIVGASGAGKSTLLHVIGALDRPTRGYVVIGGEPINDRSDDELAALRNRKVGFVFQFHHLLARVLGARERDDAAAHWRNGRDRSAKSGARAAARVGLTARMHHRPSRAVGRRAAANRGGARAWRWIRRSCSRTSRPEISIIANSERLHDLFARARARPGDRDGRRDSQPVARGARGPRAAAGGRSAGGNGSVGGSLPDAVRRVQGTRRRLCSVTKDARSDVECTLAAHLCERCAAERGIETTRDHAEASAHRFPQACSSSCGNQQADAARCTFCSTTLRDFGIRSARLRALLRRVRAEPARAAAPRFTATRSHRAAGTSRPRSRVHGAVVNAGRASRAAAARGRDGAVRAGGDDPRPDQGTRVMLDLSLLPDGGAGWLDASGDHADIVLSTRIRLARNLEGYAFAGRARDGERLRILSQVREALAARAGAGQRRAAARRRAAADDRLLLHERHLVSRELADSTSLRACAAARLLYLSRVGGRHGERGGSSPPAGAALGLQCERGARAVMRSTELGERVPYAFHDEFGFLTACPTNAGTGLRASVLIHLPGLVLTKEIGEGARRTAADGADLSRAVRRRQRSRREFLPDLEPDDARPVGGGAAGSSDASGNRTSSSGKRKRDEYCLRDAGYIIEDKLWRAYGTLRYARSLTFDEAMNYLSGVRLAVGSETDHRSECIYPQQAPDIQSVSAPGLCRGPRADDERSEPGARDDTCGRH